MKKIINKISLAVFALAPTTALAYDAPDVTIKEPKSTEVSSILGNVIDWVLILVGAIAVLFIVWSGIQYITASGNKDKAENAKKTLTYAVLGLIVIVLAKVIVELVIKLPTDRKSVV